jgi:hypothetical protein
MLKVVSNTTPLISLLKLSRLEILRELYGNITIPNAVFEEIEKGRNKLYYQDLSELDWIDIQQIQDKQALKYFLDLDAGEAEAIVLATENNVDLVIIDEQLGRFHANHVGLKVTGTIGVLLKAKSKGIIREVKPLLYELIKKGVLISDKLLNKIIELANEQ